MIYHLATTTDWEKALLKGKYHHPSLDSEGFIHCSTMEQLIPSAEKHFKEAQELVVLEISERLVKDHLKYEESRDGHLFPHIYAKIRLTQVVNTRIIFRNAEGDWEWD